MNKKIIFSAFVLFLSIFFADCTFEYSKVIAATPTKTVAKQTSTLNATPLAIVATPEKYLNKTVKMQATFDKFSTLGLDYKKAMRSSTDYIGILIQRDDVVNHNIPLSEMKLFLKRDVAEKYIDLKTNDEVYIEGSVFSDALGDAWIDVQKLELIKKAPEKKDGV